MCRLQHLYASSVYPSYVMLRFSKVVVINSNQAFSTLFSAFHPQDLRCVVAQRIKQLSRRILVGMVLCSSLCAPVYALPSHFGDKVEAALACHSEWSTQWWRSYFRLHLDAPIRVWGEAEWFKGKNAQLAGNRAKEVFVNTPESGALMVGVLIESPVETVRKNIESRMGFRFVAIPGPYPRYLSQFGSVLGPVSEKQTKWYCARWNLGNRP